jgi:hypothetical protein
MLGYFDKDSFKENQKLYPNLAALDESITKLLRSDAAKKWDVGRREVEICRRHPIYWMEKYGFIKAGEVLGGSEEVGIIPFRLNHTQLQTANQICKAFLKKPWSRVQAVVLKHRKAGTSTLFAGFDYWLARFIRMLNLFVIADLGSHTDNIVAMIELFHKRDECGKGLDPKFRPPKRVPMPKNKKGLKFSNGSMVEQDSGENSNPGTSGTIQVLHNSEFSKWRDKENAETSLLNSIPRTGFAFIVKESTAFGLNKFSQDCEDAERGKSNWDFIFISWKDLPDCEYSLDVGEELQYDEKEAELAAAYKLRPGHVKFRRSQIELLGSEERFRQDFPLNSKEPFLVTGANFFNASLVQERIMEIKFYHDWKIHGEDGLEEKYPEIVQRVKHHPGGKREALALYENRNVLPEMKCIVINREKVTLVPPPKGGSKEAVTVFRLPRRDRRYLLTIDVAEGIKTDEYTSDLSIIQVFDTYNREQVAEWGGIFDEEVTAFYAVLIGRYYNEAEIAPEMNNKCGGLLKAELEKSKYRRFFYRQKISSSHRIERAFGWETTVGNKKEVCGQFRLDFKNGDCVIHSLSLLKEMLYFVDNKGKLCASSGTDDRVMATSVNLKIIADTPAYRRVVRKKIDRQMREPQAYPEYNDPFVTQQRYEQRQREVLRRHMR